MRPPADSALVSVARKLVFRDWGASELHERCARKCTLAGASLSSKWLAPAGCLPFVEVCVVSASHSVCGVIAGKRTPFNSMLYSRGVPVGVICGEVRRDPHNDLANSHARCFEVLLLLLLSVLHVFGTPSQASQIVC